MEAYEQVATSFFCAGYTLDGETLPTLRGKVTPNEAAVARRVDQLNEQDPDGPPWSVYLVGTVTA